MYAKIIKPILDFILALCAMVVVIPTVIFFGIWIKCEDGGKIFYNSQRIGKGGRLFYMYKLRTMKENAPDLRNADGSTFNSKDDPRITKIGKFLRESSIDELPQFFNVLKGNMSIIGPRADLPDTLTRYTEAERRKLDVKPGITSINADVRSGIVWKKRIQEDIKYIDNLSFGLDVKIFFKTIFIVLKRKNVYVPDNYNEQVEEFNRQEEEKIKQPL